MGKETNDKTTSSPLNSLSNAEYEKIGRALESIIIHGYAGKKRLFGMNFMRGLFFGLGSTVGATILLVIIVYSLSLFSELPLIGDLFESLQNTIRENTSP